MPGTVSFIMSQQSIGIFDVTVTVTVTVRKIHGAAVIVDAGHDHDPTRLCSFVRSFVIYLKDKSTVPEVLRPRYRPPQGDWSKNV